MSQVVHLLIVLSCLCTAVFSLCCTSGNKRDPMTNDQLLKAFLKRFDEAALIRFRQFGISQWNLETNITDYNEEQFVTEETLTAKFLNDMREAALKFNTSDTAADSRRQLEKIINIGAAAQPNSTKFAELSQIRADMENTYVRAKVCIREDECLPMEPDLDDIMAKSRDYDQLLTVWEGWRNETGRKIRQDYTEFVKLMNENVRISGYNDTGEQWRSLYESATLEEDVDALYEQIKPLYEQLHAFVRRKLKGVYGADKFPSTGHIPAHILGNMWAQQWDKIYYIVAPFGTKPSLDVTGEMVRQDYTAHKMHETAEDFFLSLGFDAMSQKFWNLSIFERPTDGREVSCVGSVWDLQDKDDFRVSTCSKITQEDLVFAHRHMAKIEYSMAFRDQPFVYREGANDAFDEAFSSLISVSVQTPEHMKLLGLVNDTSSDNETDINYFMREALLKLAFLPYGYMTDRYRWSIFRGDTTPDNYTKVDWGLRCSMQGISPPVPRTEEDFDAGAKYHIAANVPYLGYFLSFIMQFQFHEAACKEAGHNGPLHKCDIYNSKAAGAKLREVLKLGSSKPWPEAMKMLTGQEKIDAGPLLKFFQPLMDFLRKENGEDFGWDKSCPEGFVQ